MKKIKVGINGMGRIGRAIFRINLKSDQLEVVAINDINPDVDNIGYLLKYDSTYGRLEQNIKISGSKIYCKDQESTVYNEENILSVPWEKHDVDIVIDASGVKSNLEAITSPNLQSSVKHFIVTNAPSANIKTIIFGVNEDEFDPKKHRVVSSSICDTIALTPILKELQKTHSIESGFLTTLHPWLSYQNLLDGPSVSWSQPGDIYSHYALGRATTQNLIPKSTSAVRAADLVFPELSDRLQSFSYRVPTQIVSSAVLILMLDKEIKGEELISRLKDAESKQKVKVFKNSVEPLTSLDYAGEDYSVIIDHRWTKVEKGRHLKLVYWYDNEWGYSNRVVDVVSHIGSKFSS